MLPIPPTRAFNTASTTVLSAAFNHTFVMLNNEYDIRNTMFHLLSCFQVISVDSSYFRDGRRGANAPRIA